MLSYHAMRRFCAVALLLSMQKISWAVDLFPAQQEFSADLAQKFQALEKSHTHTVAGIDGWLFLPSERSEEHTSELQSQSNLVCHLPLEKTKSSMTTRFR